ncbi:MAG: hypothetical protein KBT34_04915 [Prevotella sp.]|nr:hypothetical protein [Candidatus Prevotella equi]
MTHTYQTSQLSTRTRYNSFTKCFSAEVMDFDNETHYFDDIEAETYEEASSIVASLCTDFDILSMNIYLL